MKKAQIHADNMKKSMMTEAEMEKPERPRSPTTGIWKRWYSIIGRNWIKLNCRVSLKSKKR